MAHGAEGQFFAEKRPREVPSHAMQGRASHNARRGKSGEREPVSRRGAKAASYKEEGFIQNPSSLFNGLGQAVMPCRDARP